MKYLVSIPFSEAAIFVQSAQAEEPARGVVVLGGNGVGATRGQPHEASADSGALGHHEESGGAGECRIRLTYQNQFTAYATVEERQLALAYANPTQEAGRFTRRSCDEAVETCQIPDAGCSRPSSFNETMQADNAWVCGTHYLKGINKCLAKVFL